MPSSKFNSASSPDSPFRLQHGRKPNKTMAVHKQQPLHDGKVQVTSQHILLKQAKMRWIPYFAITLRIISKAMALGSTYHPRPNHRRSIEIHLHPGPWNDAAKSAS